MDFIRGIFNWVADPRAYFLLMLLALVFMVYKRDVFASKAVGYGLLGFLTLFFVLGGLDPNFRLIITKPDNVPIVGLIFLLVFFTWYSIREAVLNDQRIAKERATGRSRKPSPIACGCGPTWFTPSSSRSSSARSCSSCGRSS
jgi:hypothetical protein